ncbi:hypothetical protein EPUS_07808 [Endocarpon pusillum Z07020]|uniref:Mitotic checkpoint regulator, MAD2B-interacting-domain-containing protein n=1 Tax=Endocarpon pusillum (strain Z07020 / HMAS-L-300199) TaxID=1263415 RepID=U1HZW9_ENDPU|nr:uncharacterized protein EPUS_07808 [Endocarpon pusillum Z07020]ERF75119.1 hypothetical protein EPUS_07808 [Endocarpon pusillum Z07020]
MVLVAYSESEDSEDEKPQAPAKKDIPASSTKPDNKFIVDKSNPRKIKVNLQEVNTEITTNGDPDGEPAPKRPKIGGGFSGFNSMLPAPKRDTQTANGTKPGANGTARRVFSLKTGAEPGFSRESDAELKELFAEQATNPLGAQIGGKIGDGSENSDTDRRLTLSQPSASPLLGQGNAIMFKPLSVARNTKKKKPAPKSSASSTAAQEQSSKPAPGPELQASAAAPKVKLFSIGNADVSSDAANIQQSEYEPLVYQGAALEDAFDRPSDETEVTTIPLDNTTTTDTAEASTQSLDSIATDLNLSASAKRQLLGRNHKDASKISPSIINFNTDHEYAANEALRASGEQVLHNPVRAIAPGKHSLKQLVSAASGQKEALEESFASGRRNKKEAGGRYGW